jgi:arabinose-5-phosphate isomerase
MSRKGLGVTAVVDGEDQLQGVISDGDIRRLLEKGNPDVLTWTAEQCMKADPKTISGAELAPAALQQMESHRITSLFVTDRDGKLEGVLHLHDLWGLQLF